MCERKCKRLKETNKIMKEIFKDDKWEKVWMKEGLKVSCRPNKSGI